MNTLLISNQNAFNNTYSTPNNQDVVSNLVVLQNRLKEIHDNILNSDDVHDQVSSLLTTLNEMYPSQMQNIGVSNNDLNKLNGLTQKLNDTDPSDLAKSPEFRDELVAFLDYLDSATTATVKSTSYAQGEINLGAQYPDVQNVADVQDLVTVTSSTGNAAAAKWKSQYDVSANASITILSSSAVLSIMSMSYDSVAAFQQTSNLFQSVLNNLADFMSFVSLLTGLYNEVLSQAQSDAQKDSKTQSSTINWTDSNFITAAQEALTNSKYTWTIGYDVSQSPNNIDWSTLNNGQAEEDEIYLSLLTPAQLNDPSFNQKEYCSDMHDSYKGLCAPLMAHNPTLTPEEIGQLLIQDPTYGTGGKEDATDCCNDNSNILPTYPASAVTVYFTASDMPSYMQQFCLTGTDGNGGDGYYGINPAVMLTALTQMSSEIALVMNTDLVSSNSTALNNNTTTTSLQTTLSDDQNSINSNLSSLISQIQLLQQVVTNMQGMWSSILSMLQGIISNLTS